MIDLFFRFNELIISIFMLITTGVISIFAIRISMRQLYVQKLQLKHDLYERRFKIFNDLITQYGDFDRINVISLKDRNSGVKHWLDANEYHINFLFEESVMIKAKKLKNELGLAFAEYNKVNPDPETIKKIDYFYMDLKSEISSVLSFRNLM